MLPLTLLALVQAQLIYAQQAPLLQVDTVHNYTGNTLPRSSIFSLPASATLSVSVALCADVSSLPRFFLTNDSTITQPGPDSSGGANVFEISLEDGYGQWTGMMSDGGYLAVSNAGQTPFEIGVSDQGKSSFDPIYLVFAGAFCRRTIYGQFEDLEMVCTTSVITKHVHEVREVF